jgi:hypothetical protein
MANAVVGEILLKIGDREFTLRPSFNGLAEIESRADCGILQLAKHISEGGIRIKFLVAMIYGGIVGATPDRQKPEITYDELGELVIKNNYISLVPEVVKWFGAAIVGDPVAQKKTDQ